jgi:hypothetical protein
VCSCDLMCGCRGEKTNLRSSTNTVRSVSDAEPGAFACTQCTVIRIDVIMPICWVETGAFTAETATELSGAKQRKQPNLSQYATPNTTHSEYSTMLVANDGIIKGKVACGMATEHVFVSEKFYNGTCSRVKECYVDQRDGIKAWDAEKGDMMVALTGRLFDWMIVIFLVE